MDEQTYKNLGDQPGNSPVDVHNPIIPKSMAYTLVTAIGGLCVVLVLKDVFIITVRVGVCALLVFCNICHIPQYRLPYPTGFAYGTMVNGLYQSKG